MKKISPLTRRSSLEMMRSDEAGVDRIAMKEKRKKKANRDPMLSFSRSIGEARALTS